ncbi:LacI family DNA-binding transcriptional regulator [Liquorilactobacillus aquaticus]|uniref:LacI family DNA-binding transcriptional regulator n=1 Tax=Liquorilactobacillus aquaticus TaxID=392566 RepID=UPI0007093092|nr:LacI family DNA-binding transcriptional regulator [Liquorilactobacillus aquaticus]
MSKKINAYDIAKVAHVSPSTVSRVLNHKNNVNLITAQKVEEVIKKLEFKRNKDKNTAKIILLNIPDLSNTFYADIIEGIKAAANANQYHLLIDQTDLGNTDIQHFMNLVRRLQISGLITFKQLSLSILNRLSSIIKVVQCNEFNPASDLPYVTINDYSAAKDATIQLLRTGKRNIGLINGPKSFRYAYERERGFKDALKEYNISTTKEWLISLPAIKYEIALPIVSQLLSAQPHPDAFFCVSDTLGAAVINAAQKYRLRVPADIAVIGFDNTMISQIITPPLTTVNQPRFQIGYSSVELFKNFDHKNRHLQLETEFIVRNSI